ncbi:MAG: porin family protein [Bacteroidota bacterium]
MKKSALNLLWQQKRNDLPIDENPQADWAEMNQLLNEQMPVGTGATATPSLFKTFLAHIARFKLLFSLAALLVAGTAAYFLIDHGTIVQTKPDNHSETKANKSALQNNPANNLAITDSVANKAVADDNNAVTNGAKKSLDNKNKASVPVSHTNAGTINTAGGAPKATVRINNSADKALLLVNNGKANTKGSNLKNRISSLSADEKRRTSSSRRIDIVSRPQSNHGYRSNSRTNFNNSVSRIGDRNNIQGDVRKTRVSGPGTGRPATGLPDYTQRQPKEDIIQAWQPQFFNWDAGALLAQSANSKLIIKTPDVGANIKAPASAKIKKDKTGWSLPIDWGLLAGVNAPGSFTSTNKVNTNGVPFDVSGGLFADYTLNNKWSVNLQVKLPSPHQAKGNYSHTEDGKTDTGKTQIVNSKITDSRKMYMVDIPLHLVYHVNPNIGIKAGPVLSIPLQDANGIGIVTTTGTPKDSLVYIAKMSDALNHTSIERKVYYGVSGGISLNYGRFLLDATYYHNFQAQKVSSSLGGYTSNNNSLQIAIGFRLNKKR